MRRRARHGGLSRWCPSLEQEAELPRARGAGRIVVTGVGAVTPLGVGASAFWDGLVAGRSGAVRLDELDQVDLERSDVRIAAPVPEFEPADHMPRKAARRMARFAQFAVAASGEALEDSGLVIGP